MFNILREWLLTQRNALPCIRVIITMRSGLFPANSALDCVRFAKFRPQFSEPCGATYRRSRPYTIAVELFFKSFSYLYQVHGAHTLFRRFLDLPQFLTAISRKLWRHLATNVRTK